MKISVLTVCRNVSGTIGATLDSFFAQTHADKEIIIIDGASTDETLDIIRSYPQDAITLVWESDNGMYDALNKALRLYSGDAFGVLNADDSYHDETALARIAAGLAEADIVHGHLDFVADHDTKRVVRRWRGEPQPASGFRSGWMPAHPTFYVRRQVAEAVRLFDLTMQTASDYDWMVRAIEVADHGTELIEHVLIDMMQGGRSTSSLASYVQHNLEALRSRRRWLGAGLVDFALIAKPARKIGQFIEPRRKAGRA